MCAPNRYNLVLGAPARSADAVPYIAGCAVDASGNVNVATSYTKVPTRASVVINGPAKVYKVTPAGTLSVLAGKDYPGYADGQGTDAMFVSPGQLSGCLRSRQYSMINYSTLITLFTSV